MSELHTGDRVRFIEGYTNWEGEGTITDLFCDYGDHRATIVLDVGGQKVEASEYSIELVSDDTNYEYNVRITYDHEYLRLQEDEWCTLEGAMFREDRLTTMWADRGTEEYTAKIVKRRKAGPVEDAE